MRAFHRGPSHPMASQVGGESFLSVLMDYPLKPSENSFHDLIISFVGPTDPGWFAQKHFPAVQKKKIGIMIGKKAHSIFNRIPR